MQQRSPSTLALARARARGPVGRTAGLQVGDVEEARRARAGRQAGPRGQRLGPRRRTDPNTADPLPLMAAARAPSSRRRSRSAPISGWRATTAFSRSFSTSAATPAASAGRLDGASRAAPCAGRTPAVWAAPARRARRRPGRVGSSRSGTAITTCSGCGSGASRSTVPRPIESCGPGQRKKGTSAPTARGDVVLELGRQLEAEAAARRRRWRRRRRSCRRRARRRAGCAW